jgi:hypothetical protein
VSVQTYRHPVSKCAYNLGRETICFRHLLSVGFHSWEAAFRWQYEKNWHQIHTNWSRQWIDWTSAPDYRPNHIEDQTVWYASTLTNINPLKPDSVRLGFYDNAPTQASHAFVVYTYLQRLCSAPLTIPVCS